jgi:hypothetical protein
VNLYVFMLQREKNSHLCASERQNKGGSKGSEWLFINPNADFGSTCRGRTQDKEPVTR